MIIKLFVSLSLFLYLVFAFVFMDWIWLSDIPSWSQSDRALFLLLGLFVYWVAFGVMLGAGIDVNKKHKDQGDE